MFKTVPEEFEFQALRPAPLSNAGPIGWMRENLFSSPLNIVLTLLGVYIIWSKIPPLLNWAIFDAS